VGKEAGGSLGQRHKEHSSEMGEGVRETRRGERRGKDSMWLGSREKGGGDKDKKKNHGGNTGGREMGERSTRLGFFGWTWTNQKSRHGGARRGCTRQGCKRGLLAWGKKKSLSTGRKTTGNRDGEEGGIPRRGLHEESVYSMVTLADEGKKVKRGGGEKAEKEMRDAWFLR